LGKNGAARAERIAAANHENLNGLVRQYFPKKHDFDLIKPEDVVRVQNKLNDRPRKRFGFQSPNEVFSQAIKNNGQVAFVI
jgi:transposase, IS30 family